MKEGIKQGVHVVAKSCKELGYTVEEAHQGWDGAEESYWGKSGANEVQPGQVMYLSTLIGQTWHSVGQSNYCI